MKLSQKRTCDRCRAFDHGEYRGYFCSLGFSVEQTVKEVERCLNCDIQTAFVADLCIECDACIDVCPVNCLTMTENGTEDELRTRLSAPAENIEQDLYVSEQTEFGWSDPWLLPPPINSVSNDGYPSFSPDGHLFFFASDRGNTLYDIYFVEYEALGLGTPRQRSAPY